MQIIAWIGITLAFILATYFVIIPYQAHDLPLQLYYISPAQKAEFDEISKLESGLSFDDDQQTPSSQKAGFDNSLFYKSPHLGPPTQFNEPYQHLSASNNNTHLPLNLPFDKRIDVYGFSFYNWYRFEIKLIDLSYKSLMKVTVFSEQSGIAIFQEAIGVKLPENFFCQLEHSQVQHRHHDHDHHDHHLLHQKEQKHKESNEANSESESSHLNQTNMNGTTSNDSSKHANSYNSTSSSTNKKDCCKKCDSLNYKLQRNGLNLTIRQRKLQAGSGKHDGFMHDELFVQDEEHKGNFSSVKTVTHFQLNVDRSYLKLKINLTHIIRHNQCFNLYDPASNIWTHKCAGGYATGALDISRHEGTDGQSPIMGRHSGWVTSSYKVNPERGRTFFIGRRSNHHLGAVTWQWEGFEGLMIGFNKNEYYRKHETIQKERWVGLMFSQSKHLGPSDYLFINGKMYPLPNLKYELNFTKIAINRNITFFAAEKNVTFEATFHPLIRSEQKKTHLFSKEKTLKIEGYWSGVIIEQDQDEYDFFNVTGYLETSAGYY